MMKMLHHQPSCQMLDPLNYLKCLFLSLFPELQRIVSQVQQTAHEKELQTLYLVQTQLQHIHIHLLHRYILFLLNYMPTLLCSSEVGHYFPGLFEHLILQRNFQPYKRTHNLLELQLQN